MMTRSLDEALRLCEDARRKGSALSVGLVGNCAEVLPEMVRRGVHVDVVTDQTSAHDPLNGYIPPGYSLAEARQSCGSAIRKNMSGARRLRWSCMCDAMLELQRAGAVAFDYGNNIRRVCV